MKFRLFKNLPESAGRIADLFAYTGIAIVGTLLIMLVLIQLSILPADVDIKNWVTLVIELGIGIGIALSILIYTKSEQEKYKKQQDKMTKILKRIETIEQTQQKMIGELHEVLKNEKERIERWKSDWGTIILADLESINAMYDILENWLKEYMQDPSVQLKTNIIESAKRNGHIVDFHIQNIERHLTNIERYFEDPTLGLNLHSISEHISTLFQSLHMEYHWESKDLLGPFELINDKKRILTQFITRLKKEIP